MPPLAPIALFHPQAYSLLLLNPDHCITHAPSFSCPNLCFVRSQAHSFYFQVHRLVNNTSFFVTHVSCFSHVAHCFCMKSLALVRDHISLSQSALHQQWKPTCFYHYLICLFHKHLYFLPCSLPDMSARMPAT